MTTTVHLRDSLNEIIDNIPKKYYDLASDTPLNTIELVINDYVDIQITGAMTEFADNDIYLVNITSTNGLYDTIVERYLYFKRLKDNMYNYVKDNNIESSLTNIQNITDFIYKKSKETVAISFDVYCDCMLIYYKIHILIANMRLIYITAPTGLNPNLIDDIRMTVQNMRNEFDTYLMSASDYYLKMSTELKEINSTASNKSIEVNHSKRIFGKLLEEFVMNEWILYITYGFILAVVFVMLLIEYTSPKSRYIYAMYLGVVIIAFIIAMNVYFYYTFDAFEMEPFSNLLTSGDDLEYNTDTATMSQKNDIILLHEMVERAIMYCNTREKYAVIDSKINPSIRKEKVKYEDILKKLKYEEKNLKGLIHNQMFSVYITVEYVNLYILIALLIVFAYGLNSFFNMGILAGIIFIILFCILLTLYLFRIEKVLRTDYSKRYWNYVYGYSLN